MRISCPKCSARYLVPDQNIGEDGRRVRCARCSTVWKTEGVDPSIDMTPDPATIAPEDTDTAHEAPPIRVDPVPRSHAPAPIAPKSRRGMLGWIIFGVLVLGILATLIFGAKTIMALWPASTRIYEAVGFGPSSGDESSEGQMQKPAPKRTDGLTSSTLTHEWVQVSGGGYDLKVTGKVSNNSKSERPSAYIRVRLLDKQGAIIRDKRKLLGGGAFAPGDSRSFSFQFRDPGDGVAKAIPGIETAR